MLVEVQWWPGRLRCLGAVKSLTSGRFRFVREGGVSGPFLLLAKNITDWEAQLEVMGCIIGSEALAVTLPSRKLFTLHNILAGCPPLSYICFRGAGVAARWLSHACFLCCASGAFSL